MSPTDSIIDYERDEARTARYAAERSGPTEHGQRCRCRECLDRIWREEVRRCP